MVREPETKRRRMRCDVGMGECKVRTQTTRPRTAANSGTQDLSLTITEYLGR